MVIGGGQRIAAFFLFFIFQIEIEMDDGATPMHIFI